MIKLDDIKDRAAISKLGEYEGKNPYITQLKKELKRKGKIILTDTQSKYIMRNYESDPIKINKVLEITEFLGTELQKKEGLTFIPKKILVQYILGDTEKSLHVYGKIKQNQDKSKMYWIPKTQLVDDPYFVEKEIEVDFDKYAGLDTLKRTPYQHQKEGIEFLLSRNGCILADDMGLGKTYQAIVAALESGAERILIVCPSSVKITWEREINCFCDSTSIISGKKWSPDKFTIINYDILKNFHTIDKKKKKAKKGEPEEVVVFNKQLVNHKFDLCVVDEAHFLKNHKSIRGKVMVDLCVKHGIEKVWLLTGTPIANRPMDYYNLLQLIKAPVADNWAFFATRYCEAKKFFKTLKNGARKQIWITDGASNLDELASKTKNLVLRRKKVDVLDMPDKTIVPNYLELGSRGWGNYDRLWDEYIEKRKEDAKKGGKRVGNVELQRELVELILLRKFISMEAIPNTIQLTDDAIEQEQKVIIFTNFTDELMELHEHYGSASVVHYGEMNQRQKQASVDAFMTDPKVTVFIGNVKSAGVGITLTAANIVIFNSFDWVPGNNEQAEDRAYRIGQKNNVTVYYQLFMDTISIRMWTILKDKQDVISQIMGEQKVSTDEEEIMNYMKQLKDEKD